MKNLAARIQSFSYRADWLGSVMRSQPAAALFLLRSKFDRMQTGTGYCGGFPFVFRGCDVNAVQEVLVDNEYGFLRSLLEGADSPRILDIGTHIGLFSLWALSVNPRAQIFSVEASPDTFVVLEENIGRAQKIIPAIAWRAVNRAAWSNSEPIRFSSSGDSMSHRVSSTGSADVRGMTLREVMETGFPQKTIDLMKIDIEGAEEEFICAMPDLLKAVNSLVIELHPNLCNTARVEGVLQEAFSTIETVAGRTSSKPLLYCRK